MPVKTGATWRKTRWKKWGRKLTPISISTNPMMTPWTWKTKAPTTTPSRNKIKRLKSTLCLYPKSKREVHLFPMNRSKGSVPNGKITTSNSPSYQFSTSHSRASKPWRRLFFLWRLRSLKPDRRRRTEIPIYTTSPPTKTLGSST